ncbi:MAG: anthranilate synthase component I family protein [Marinilabiliales bacterium]|nr:MAG: anthranilate synthase component I family protein [Marinilabiliales bacterium]
MVIVLLKVMSKKSRGKGKKNSITPVRDDFFSAISFKEINDYFCMMRIFSSFRIDNVNDFKAKLLDWSRDFNEVCILDSNGYSKRFNSPTCSFRYDYLAAIGSVNKMGQDEQGNLEAIGKFSGLAGDWLFGHLSYDIKNETENLSSSHPDRIGFPLAEFFVPGYIFVIDGNNLQVGWLKSLSGEVEINRLVKEIDSLTIRQLKAGGSGPVKEVMTKKEYLEAVKRVMGHIGRGNIYEVNICQEFFSSIKSFDPGQAWLSLIEESPTPFSCYYNLGDKYLLCASPERFMKRTGNRIISQPIKGTAARGNNVLEDEQLLRKLATDPKERAENVMITDLVRNDLSVIAERGSVKVDELCGIYPFPRVFQMQSTISALIRPKTSLVDIIRALFPMGSMTGAPKIRAMEIIEQYERSRRGLYSGAVGYITPQNDFDFNVVIRSIQYNRTSEALSFMVGGAITSLSDPEKEFAECMLKAGAIMKILGTGR